MTLSTRILPTYKFRVWRAVAEVDSRDVEHVTHVVVGVTRSIWIDVVTLPLLPRKLQRNGFNRHDLTWRQYAHARMHLHNTTLQ